VYSRITLDDGRSFTQLAQIFDRGLKVAGPGAPYLGHRPTVSTDPLKFADHFVWSTWGEIAKRRLDVGSGIESLFRSGDAVKANGLETVGLWSANTPGQFSFHMFLRLDRSRGVHHRVFPSAVTYWRAADTHTHVVPTEWRILDLALSLYGKVVVPLYENFGPDSIGASAISSGVHFGSSTNNTIKSTCGFLDYRAITPTY